jgi:cyclic pyranopterin phosphate synthase
LSLAVTHNAYRAARISIMSEARLTHLSPTGEARMVDVGDKPVTRREAVAEGFIALRGGTIRAITTGSVPKGEVLNTARVAGIIAAKRCGELIPMCHPLPIDSVEIRFELPDPPDDNATVRLRIEAAARVTAKTGVEMEALTAVSVAALTVYDMVKAIDKTMIIEGVRLLKKTGGTKG